MQSETEAEAEATHKVCARERGKCKYTSINAKLALAELSWAERIEQKPELSVTGWLSGFVGTSYDGWNDDDDDDSSRPVVCGARG